MFCKKCGAQNEDDASFCVDCGTSTVRTSRTASSASPADTLDGAQTISADALRPGRELAGRYRIIEKLGAGGMGLVFKAHDGELDIPVAVKVLPPILARTERSVDGLRREAGIALRLSHPHICRLHNFHADGDVKFLVMEYIDGVTLEQLLAERPDNKMSWDELRPIVDQIGSALAYAHDRQPSVLHRDIKPANIMIASDGSAKLLDFGIAREMRDSLTRATGMQDTAGTVPYMSPEQFRGEPVDRRSDVYSLCTVLYEALAGMPFVSSGGSLAWQVQEKLFEPISGLPDEANAILAEGLAKRPEGRRPGLVVSSTAAHVLPPLPPADRGEPDRLAAPTLVSYASDAAAAPMERAPVEPPARSAEDAQALLSAMTDRTTGTLSKISALHFFLTTPAATLAVLLFVVREGGLTPTSLVGLACVLLNVIGAGGGFVVSCPPAKLAERPGARIVHRGCVWLVVFAWILAGSVGCYFGYEGLLVGIPIICIAIVFLFVFWLLHRRLRRLTEGS